MRRAGGQRGGRWAGVGLAASLVLIGAPPAQARPAAPATPDVTFDAPAQGEPGPADAPAVSETCTETHAAAPARAGRPMRVALVVGVAHYQGVEPLRNTLNDARLVGCVFGNLGFAVTLVVDPRRAELDGALDAFAAQAKGAEAAVVYFAGHGAEVAGVNYLFARDASNASLDRLVAGGVTASRVREAVLDARTVRLVILDACRDNPARGRALGLPPGLARESGGDTIRVVTLLAAAPGQAALDGSGGNGPFAAALSRVLRRPGLTTIQLPRQVQSEVQALTHNRQSPDLQGLWSDIRWTFDAAAAR